jgi:hypothetical protein
MGKVSWLEDYIAKKDKSHGWEVINTNKPGLPDLIELRKGGRIRFIEVKDNDDLTNDQAKMLSLLRSLGFDANVVEVDMKKWPRPPASNHNESPTDKDQPSPSDGDTKSRLEDTN